MDDAWVRATVVHEAAAAPAPDRRRTIHMPATGRLPEDLTRHYKPLRAAILGASTYLRCRGEAAVPRVGLGSPASSVMTDFDAVPPVTVEPRASLDEARRIMADNGVRLLLVTGDSGLVFGLVTTSDLLRNKPRSFGRPGVPARGEVEVRQVMTPAAMLETLELHQVLQAKVGHVVATLKGVGRQHALVVEPAVEGACYIVRGLFSASQIARRLGVRVHVGNLARTLAEIEMLLNHASAPARRHWRAARAPSRLS